MAKVSDLASHRFWIYRVQRYRNYKNIWCGLYLWVEVKIGVWSLDYYHWYRFDLVGSEHGKYPGAFGIIEWYKGVFWLGYLLVLTMKLDITKFVLNFYTKKKSHYLRYGRNAAGTVLLCPLTLFRTQNCLWHGLDWNQGLYDAHPFEWSTVFLTAFLIC